MWMRRGYCVGANPDIFSEPGYEETAKGYCQRCPVTKTCFDWAVKFDEDGVWGGTTTDERKALKRVGSRRSCPGCQGTQLYSDGRSEICLSCGFSWLT